MNGDIKVVWSEPLMTKGPKQHYNTPLKVIVHLRRGADIYIKCCLVTVGLHFQLGMKPDQMEDDSPILRPLFMIKKHTVEVHRLH